MALAVSATCHTTIEAISTGLPVASLTFMRAVSKLRTRTETERRVLSGTVHTSPVRRTVPT